VNATEFDEIIAASWTRKDKARARIRAARAYMAAHREDVITTIVLAFNAGALIYMLTGGN